MVDAARIVDAMQVSDPDAVAAPDFSVEVLRNEAGISLIGLVPAETGRDGIVAAAKAAAGSTPVTDMLETADHPAPADWQTTVSFGLEALKSLPRAKISIGEHRSHRDGHQ